MPNIGRYERLKLRVEAEIPGMKVVRHGDSYFIRAIHWLLRVLSVGKFEPSRFTTTIGKHMYVSDTWMKSSDQSKYTTLRHEVIHMRQFRRWPMKFLDLPVLRLINFTIFSFCYLLVFPFRITLRSKFEREAYTQTLLVHYEIAGQYPLRMAQNLVSHMGANFSDSSYFYMWNNKAARKWAADTMVAIERGEIYNILDRVNLE